MVRFRIFEIRGTAAQTAAVVEALRRCDFPWRRLKKRLLKEQGRGFIPVSLADLKPRGANGLAYYSGRIELEQTLSHEEIMRVFLAEAAHMVDFFYLTPAKRAAIFKLYHPQGIEHAPESPHGWFE